MERFQIYTAGATKNVSKDESHNWRKATRDCLEKVDEKYNVNVFIPDESFKQDSFLTVTINDREYSIRNTKKVKTHANLDDGVIHTTLICDEMHGNIVR